MEYQKRSGTSGISGQFYETKLLSLVLFRLVHDEHVEDFHLATNVDDMGAFDDICIIIKRIGNARPVAVFVQVKHKDYEDAYPTLDNKSDLIKYINSVSAIKIKFNLCNDCEPFFKTDVAETDCVISLFTNARFKLTNSVSEINNFTTEIVSSSDASLNSLFNTNNVISGQRFQTIQHLNYFEKVILEEDIKTLAERLFVFLTAKVNQSMNIMNDEYIQQYHVILKLKVVDISDVQTQASDVKFRYLTFRVDFFGSEEKYVAIFRNALFKEVIKKLSKLDKNSVM